MSALPVALVVDDSEVVRQVLRRYLTRAGYAVVEAEDGVQGAVAALRDLPALVVTDLDMPVMDGFQLARLLKHDPTTASIPLVILTSHSEASARFWGQDCGADAYVTKDELEERLLPVVRELDRQRIAARPTAQPGAATTGPLEVLARIARQLDKGLLEATLVNQLLHLGIEKDNLAAAVRAVLAFLARIVDGDLLGLCVADDSGVRAHLLRPAAAHGGVDVDRVSAFLAGAVGVAPDALTVVQVDGALGVGEGGAGPDESAAVVFRLPLRDARAVLVVWPRRRGELQGLPLELLATAAPHVALVVDNVRLAEKLWDLSTHDGLTGLLNHRAIFARLGEEVDRAARYNAPMSVALCDVDRFKRINDAHGHPAGDRVLCEVARRLRGSLRSSDLVGRYGGEEFLVILPNATLDAARCAADRLCRELAARPFPLSDAAAIPVTASFGVSCSQELPALAGSEALISLADSRLYQAKAAGRCCVRP